MPARCESRARILSTFFPRICGVCLSRGCDGLAVGTATPGRVLPGRGRAGEVRLPDREGRWPALYYGQRCRGGSGHHGQAVITRHTSAGLPDRLNRTARLTGSDPVSASILLWAAAGLVLVACGAMAAALIGGQHEHERLYGRSPGWPRIHRPLRRQIPGPPCDGVLNGRKKQRSRI